MITLIGVGPGDPDSLTVEARDAIEQADLLIQKFLHQLFDGGLIRAFLDLEQDHHFRRRLGGVPPHDPFIQV